MSMAKSDFPYESSVGKKSGGQYKDFLTPMNVGPTGANGKAGQPMDENCPETIPSDPLGIVPGGKKGK
jgi:hypothetical protein